MRNSNIPNKLGIAINTTVNKDKFQIIVVSVKPEPIQYNNKSSKKNIICRNEKDIQKDCSNGNTKIETKTRRILCYTKIVATVIEQQKPKQKPYKHKSIEKKTSKPKAKPI